MTYMDSIRNWIQFEGFTPLHHFGCIDLARIGKERFCAYLVLLKKHNLYALQFDLKRKIGTTLNQDVLTWKFQNFEEVQTILDRVFQQIAAQSYQQPVPGVMTHVPPVKRKHQAVFPGRWQNYQRMESKFLPDTKQAVELLLFRKGTQQWIVFRTEQKTYSRWPISLLTALKFYQTQIEHIIQLSS